MNKNALKMQLIIIYLCIVFLSSIKCELRLQISDYFDPTRPINSTIELLTGTNYQLVCTIEGDEVFSNPGLRWGRKTKDLKFRNETDLIALAEQRSKALFDIQNSTFFNYYSYHYQSKVLRSFRPVKITDRGAHFCMSLKYMLFKLVHIKVKEVYLDSGKFYSECTGNKFQCISSGICINSHYKCDGKHDCKDGSDEDWDTCNGPACFGKIHCRDGRCIPKSWCCDKHTDDDCNVTIRPDCCPPLQNPYDPMLWYTGQNATKAEATSTGSKYLFITICVVSALLSFILFLFVISKICGFDAIPIQRTVNIPPSSCDHSECILGRQFSTNNMCLYRQDANVMNNDNNNDLGDSLILINAERVTDQPPSYAEVINSPPIMDKSTLELLSIPPPPYSSTKYGQTDQSQNCDSSGDNLTT